MPLIRVGEATKPVVIQPPLIWPPPQPRPELLEPPSQTAPPQSMLPVNGGGFTSITGPVIL